MTLKLDENHDLAIEGGTFAAVYGDNNIAQRIKTRLLFWRGEWFMDTSDGTPWYERVLGKTGNRAVIGAVIRRRIIQTPGVASITDFDIELDRTGRSVRVVRFSVLTDAGDTITGAV